MLLRKVHATTRRLRGRTLRQPIKLPFPVPASLRIAALSAAPAFQNAQPLLLERFTDLPAFQPNVVIGSAADLARLAQESSGQAIDTSAIDHAVVVITSYRGVPLSDMQRVCLWQSFGVPLFELYLGVDGALLAYECEAHEGWHLADGIQGSMFGGELVLDGNGNQGLRTGITASIVRETCPCNHPAARLLNVELLPEDCVDYVAASA